jgi:hypothetical protein
MNIHWAKRKMRTIWEEFFPFIVPKKDIAELSKISTASGKENTFYMTSIHTGAALSEWV